MDNLDPQRGIIISQAVVLEDLIEITDLTIQQQVVMAAGGLIIQLNLVMDHHLELLTLVVAVLVEDLDHQDRVEMVDLELS